MDILEFNAWWHNDDAFELLRWMAGSAVPLPVLGQAMYRAVTEAATIWGELLEKHAEKERAANHPLLCWMHRFRKGSECYYSRKWNKRARKTDAFLRSIVFDKNSVWSIANCSYNQLEMKVSEGGDEISFTIGIDQPGSTYYYTCSKKHTEGPDWGYGTTIVKNCENITVAGAVREGIDWRDYPGLTAYAL